METRELEKARKQASEIIYSSDEFIVLTPEKGAKTYCTKASLLSLITCYLNYQISEELITKEEIDLICKYAKMSESELEIEKNITDKKIKEELKEVLKSNDKFMEFIKDLLG